MPVGRLAFFFTDLEGSTKQWEAHPELMHLAVSRHDELMVGSIERWNGIVFSTEATGSSRSSLVLPMPLPPEWSSSATEEPWPSPLVSGGMAAHVGRQSTRPTTSALWSTGPRIMR
jgi:hypothetical protein